MKIIINGREIQHHAKEHFKKHWKLYAQAGLIAAGTLLMGPSTAFAASSIDSKAYPVYWKIVGIGKWVIVIKAIIDIIQAILNGEHQAARKMFFGYLGCFAVMLALPWGMDQIEEVFKA